MKTIRNLFSLVVLFIFAAACHHRGNTIVVNDGISKLKINYSGEIRFTDDELAIQSISPEGYLRYQKNDKKVFAVRDLNGRIKYEFYDQGRKLTEEDPDARKMLAEAIQEMISVGFDAQGRIKRLNEKGGLRAVLNAVDHINGDFVKSMYLEYLISSDSIRPNQMIEIAEKIVAQIGSDFEKGKLLKGFSAATITDSLVSKAYQDVAKSIGSDFEKANALKYRIKYPINNEQFNDILGSINTVGSDFEKANLLKELIDQKIFEGESFSNLLNAVNHIGSDFEKTNVLKKLVGKEIKTDEQWIGLINGTEQVSSEFERSNVLVQLAEKMPTNDVVKTNYLKVAKTISAEMDYKRVVKAVQ